MITLLLVLLAVPSVGAQSKPGKAPKVDSIMVAVAKPKAEASDAVVAAFTAAGLSVTNTTSALIESDQGETVDGIGSYSHHRVVRATLLTAGPDTTRVLIQGTEDLIRDRRMEKRKAIDNYAGGNGRKVWSKMIAAAHELDPVGASTYPASVGKD